MKLMFKRARPCEIVSLSVTQNQTGAAIWLFSWRVLVFPNRNKRELDVTTQADRGKGNTYRPPLSTPLSKIYFYVLTAIFLFFPHLMHLLAHICLLYVHFHGLNYRELLGFLSYTEPLQTTRILWNTVTVFG
jgi:hypothetical protein